MECIAQLVERQVVALVVMGSNPIALPFQLDKTVLKKASYYEKDLESAIITHLADFLLDMARGAFVARQKRLLVEDDEYFVDLVFYNRLMRSFVILEIEEAKRMADR